AQTTASPTSHHTTALRRRDRRRRRAPPVCQSRIISPAATAAGTGVPCPMLSATPTAVRPRAMRCCPIVMARTVGPAGVDTGPAAGRRGALTRPMRHLSPVAGESARPPESVAEEVDDRGDDDGPHDECVDDHPDAHDEAELAERDEREHPERGEH